MNCRGSIEKTRCYYNNNAKEYVEKTIDLDMKSIYDKFLEHMPMHGNILDAGCGSARDSLFFKNHGFRITAFDGSKIMARVASKVLGQSVLKLSFEEIKFEDQFDGVWACASLLHVPKNEINQVIKALIGALKNRGIFYMSFNYGVGERFINGRFFNYYDEKSISVLLDGFPEMKRVDIWKSKDVRSSKKGTLWLNVISGKQVVDQ